jgi:hypothetical protein
MILIKVPYRFGASPNASGGGLVSATRTEMHRWRDVPAVLVRGLRLRSRWRDFPGAIGVQLASEPLAKATWTVSMWETEADLHRFLRSQAHIDTLTPYRDLVTVAATTWESHHFSLPAAWAEALNKLAPHTDLASMEATTLDRTRRMAMGWGGAKLAFGASLLVAPGRLGRFLYGPSADTVGGRALGRGMGARDVVIGLGTIFSRNDGAQSRWLAFGALSDIGDAGATLIAFGSLGRTRWPGLLLAMGTAAQGFTLAAKLTRLSPNAPIT